MTESLEHMITELSETSGAGRDMFVIRLVGMPPYYDSPNHLGNLCCFVCRWYCWGNGLSGYGPWYASGAGLTVEQAVQRCWDIYHKRDIPRQMEENAYKMIELIDDTPLDFGERDVEN